jgi:aspartokinase
VHGKAKIVDIRGRRIHDALDQGQIVLVAGFQGCLLSKTSPLGVAVALT